ncbi:restriction endonuclease subunit S [Klebsiella michiganensis]|uniref:restriction endonuclease subunit S n=1 Tax=Klebsiella michiganensis TaxID=1134687 RepID=UPI001914D269|nr:restriction endonuclease subunit S [Klebsiella michiganensis]
MNGGKLPEGWVVTNLQNIANWGSGGTPSRSHDEYYNGDIPWIKTGDLGPKLITEASEYITDVAVKNSSAKYFPKGSVAIAMYGATIGKTSILGIDATTNQACAVGSPIEGITSSIFLYYFLLNEKNAFIKKGKGGAQPNISQAVIKEHPLSLPPYTEQKIIAEKLDTLLAQVDSTKARLEQIPQILKRFRQAVLTTAMSGKLTNLPTANNFKIKDIACVIGGLTKNSKRNNFEKKVPYLRVANVYENELKLDDVTEIGIQPNELRRVSLEYEDLLIVEGNGSLDQIGRAAIWREEIQECVHQNHLIKVRANKEILYPTFLLFYFMSPQGKEEIVSRATSGAGLYTLSISKISSINVPVYSLPDQHEIVRRIEQLFAYADTIEKQVNNALTRVNSLTQSILAKAFRGELTAQWRAENHDLISGENSAAALLEKIKAERAASGGKKNTRKKA